MNSSFTLVFNSFIRQYIITRFIESQVHVLSLCNKYWCTWIHSRWSKIYYASCKKYFNIFQYLTTKNGSIELVNYYTTEVITGYYYSTTYSDSTYKNTL